MTFPPAVPASIRNKRARTIVPFTVISTIYCGSGRRRRDNDLDKRAQRIQQLVRALLQDPRARAAVTALSDQLRAWRESQRFVCCRRSREHGLRQQSLAALFGRRRGALLRPLQRARHRRARPAPPREGATVTTGLRDGARGLESRASGLRPAAINSRRRQLAFAPHARRTTTRRLQEVSEGLITVTLPDGRKTTADIEESTLSPEILARVCYYGCIGRNSRTQPRLK